MDSYNVWYEQFKYWLLDAYAEEYGSPVDPDELIQGCHYRQDFLYRLCTIFKWVTPPGPTRKVMNEYIDLYDQGKLGDC